MRLAPLISAVGLLAGCSRLMPSSILPIGEEHSLQAERPHFKSLYAFKSNYSDGAVPLANLISVSGVLYGTTQEGGQGYNGYSYGTVFKVTTAGTEAVVYNFGGSASDGRAPQAPLLDLKGSLYGTTREGGAGCGFYGCGTAFAVSTSGKERVLHSFDQKGGTDPEAGLTAISDMLYGTTSRGGASRSCKGGCGVIFAISTTGKERVLHSFEGGSDGASPAGNLVVLKGVLYGTTTQGGNTGCAGYGCGTVFRVTTSGDEKVLYRFKGGSDGSGPSSALFALNGSLYGTTSSGGGTGCYDVGCGTIFSLTTEGRERILHRFAGYPSDGAAPEAGLTALNGVLYGTTASGGAGCRKAGCGSIYKVTLSGKETMLHSFDFSDVRGGLYPEASLLLLGDSFYGTTESGGVIPSASSDGNGAVFEFSP